MPASLVLLNAQTGGSELMNVSNARQHEEIDWLQLITGTVILASHDDCVLPTTAVGHHFLHPIGGCFPRHRCAESACGELLCLGLDRGRYCLFYVGEIQITLFHALPMFWYHKKK